MTKTDLQRSNARLRDENSRLRAVIRELDKLSREQFKRLQEAETNAQRYLNLLAEVYGDESAA